MRKFTAEQIEILEKKYACELVRIGVLVWSGDLEGADRLAEKILIEEGMNDENGLF
jgi:hypothetical protein